MNPPKINIALIDDDQDEKYIFQIALDELKIEYSFDYFSNSFDFIDHLKNPETVIPNIAFLDMHMPKVNGLELLEQIRQNPDFSTMRTVIYSNSVSDITISAFKSLGTVDFIVKPPELSEMKEVLKRLIIAHSMA